MKDQVYIAKIGKTVGLKGQLKLHTDTDFPEQFSKNCSFVTNKKITLTIDTFNSTSKTVKFKELNTIEEAQRVINQQLFTTREDTKQNCILNDNQFFWFDLVGCKIIENGLYLGDITEVQRFPQCDYFEIQTSKNLVETENLSKVFLLPYNDNYIINVDIQNKEINVKDAMAILEAS